MLSYLCLSDAVVCPLMLARCFSHVSPRTNLDFANSPQACATSRFASPFGWLADWLAGLSRWPTELSARLPNGAPIEATSNWSSKWKRSKRAHDVNSPNSHNHVGTGSQPSNAANRAGERASERALFRPADTMSSELAGCQ